jgi:COP9 signalosome complex subunit 2
LLFSQVKKTGVLHPLNMGVIYECGGKMYLAEGDLEKASGDFYQAFLHFDEAGSAHRIVCLK